MRETKVDVITIIITMTIIIKYSYYVVTIIIPLYILQTQYYILHICEFNTIRSTITESHVFSEEKY